MSRLAGIFALAALLMVAAATRAAAQIDEAVTIVVSPPGAEVVLGDTFDLTIEVTNTGAEPTPSLVIHIDITDPNGSGSVDPEDWTSTLSKPLGVLEPGQTGTIDWSMQPISGGKFVLYAVALSADADDVATSNVVGIDVTDRRSLNPNGILPVSLGIPSAIGLLLLVQARLARTIR